MFNKTLAGIAPKMITASASPHRNVESYPPVSLSNVQEVDLQAQWEQILLPYSVPHGVDFYKRPGKRAWTHPEIWNDAGTGEQILPTLFQAVMRGADGVGFSGTVPPWGTMPEDCAPVLRRHGVHLSRPDRHAATLWRVADQSASER